MTPSSGPITLLEPLMVLIGCHYDIALGKMSKENGERWVREVVVFVVLCSYKCTR